MNSYTRSEEEVLFCVPATGDKEVSPQEERDTKTLVGLMKTVYSDVYSKFKMASIFKEPKVPDTFPAFMTNWRFGQPMGLRGCIDYLIETFGRKKEVEQYLASSPQSIQ